MTRSIRRAMLTALVCAALASPAWAQQGPPPGGPGDGARMGESRHHDRAGMRGHGRMGGMMQMLGLVPMRPGMKIEFSEGRLAFLKAELKITEAQTKAWDAFAAALRENVAKLAEAYATPEREALDKMGPAERLGWVEKALAARLEAVKRAKAAMQPLHAALSDDQKKTFDRFVPTGGMRAGMRERMDRRRGQQPAEPGQPRR